MLDVVSGAPFGLHTAVLVLLGAVASTIDGQIVRANVGFIISMGVLVTLGYHVALMLGMQALGWEAFPPERFLRVLFPAAAGNTILLPIALVISENLYRFLTGSAADGGLAHGDHAECPGRSRRILAAHRLPDVAGSFGLSPTAWP